MAGSTLRGISETDQRLFAGLRHVAPWVLGLIVLPLVIFIFRRLWADTPWIILVVVLLAAGTGYLTWLVYRQTHGRGSLLARWFGPVYTATAMTYFTAAIAIGMGDIPDSGMFVLWAVGTPILCIGWNMYYRKRSDQPEIVVTIPKVKPQTRKLAALPAASPVVDGDVISDVTAHPEVARAIERVNEQNAIIAAKAQNEAARINATKVVGGWQQLARQGGALEDLMTTKLTVTKSDNYATEVKLRLGDGSTPGRVEKARGTLAGKFRVGETDVRVIRNPRDNSDVTLRVVWFNPLDKTTWWPGPQHVGASFGAEPIVFGIREDNTPARLLLPQSDKFGKNSSHVLVEGQNGSGKSETMLIVAGEGSTRPDVCFWAIDCAKGLQTFGPVISALDWFCTDRDKARLMMKALVDFVIPGRGTLLASLGYDNWTPEVAAKHGIPYLVVIVEEGGIIFEALGKNFVKVMMLARSVGICIWGSLQRAHHEMIDTNARAQFSEVMTFGMASDEDVFGLPEEMLDMGASPQQWRNRAPGMHYHYTPLLSDVDLVTPQRSFRADKKMLRELTDRYGPNMMRPEPSLIANANRFENCYDERETGPDVERRLKVAGGIPLDDRAAVEAATTTPEVATPEPVPVRETVTLSVPSQRRMPYDMPATMPKSQPKSDVDDEFDLGPDPIEDDEDYGRGEAPREDKVIFVPGKSGEPDKVILDGEEMEVPDLDIEDDDFFDDEIPVPEETPDMEEVDGSADDEFAATSQPLHSSQILQFDDDDDDWEPSATREGARRNLLRLLAIKGAGFVFRSGDLYDEVLPYVERSKSWIRGEIIALADAGVYVELIDDPTSPDDGKYRVMGSITSVPAPQLTPVP